MDAGGNNITNKLGEGFNKGTSEMEKLSKKKKPGVTNKLQELVRLIKERTHNKYTWV